MDSHAPLRGGLLAGWLRAERALDGIFGAALNPLRQLGALGFFSFAVLAASGSILYIVLDTSAEGASRSIDALSRQPWSLGSTLRGLHRYAADAFVVFTVAHLAREWLHGRYHGFRRFSWLTGVPLLPALFICAVGGFWLNWDRLGQFSAIASAEWLDHLPLFASPLTRNFISVDSVTDRLFSLFVFVHIGVPLLMVFALWFHVQRISRAAVFPPRALAAGMMLVLLLLALAQPVQSQGAAQAAQAPAVLALDWWLLFVHPLMYATSAELVWALVIGTLALLVALPWLARTARAPVAEVDPANCNGCRRCFEDCPYAAITMVPHPNGKAGRQLAQVDADLCAACGICVGSCPSSTPFRSVAELVTGIDMPQMRLDSVRRQLEQAIVEAEAKGTAPIVVIGCDHGARLTTGLGDDTIGISLLCTGMLPPSFVDYALRAGAQGVLIAGCRAGGCEFRLGQRWTEQRLDGRREPHLRSGMPPGRIATVWAGAGEEKVLRAALDALRRRALPQVELHG